MHILEDSEKSARKWSLDICIDVIRIEKRNSETLGADQGN